MSESWQDSIKDMLNRFDLFSLYRVKKGPLCEDGWFRSFREKAPVDGNGNPIPWIAYPAIEFIGRRLSPGMSIFEYGCGGSTLWWARRVEEVVACEHDEAWYLKIREKVPGNVELHHVPLDTGGSYAGKVAEFPGRFDIVFIDGRDRVNCAVNAVKALKPEGVIIWDDSNRPDYDEGYRFLFKNGFRKIEFVGMYPLGIMKTETGIFYRPGNIFNI